MTSTKTATFVRRRDGNGDGRVYRLDPPLKYTRWNGDGVDEITTDHVWVSAANVTYSGPETYIFASDADGEVSDWCELPGSFRGDLDHAKALSNVGYEVSA